MTYGSLFAGIGGFDLGFDRAGMRCLWQVERDKDCRKVLNRHWPGVPKMEDVRDAGARNLIPVDVVCGGSPCQDLSHSGKRAGLGGERSGLFFEYIRIVRELGPQFCVFENVPGVLSSNGGRDFALVLGGFTGLVPRVPHQGWGSCGVCAGPLGVATYRLLDSQWFGLAQRRLRLFLVFSAGTAGSVEILAFCEGLRWHPGPFKGADEENAASAGKGATAGNVAAIAVRTAQTSSNGWGVDDSGTSYTLDGAEGQAVCVATEDGPVIRRLLPVECERLQGFPDHWTNGQPDSARYRQLGNAVSVPVADWIGNRIVEHAETLPFQRIIG